MDEYAEYSIPGLNKELRLAEEACDRLSTGDPPTDDFGIRVMLASLEKRKAALKRRIEEMEKK